jgi:molecular chaperone DnaK
MIEPIVARAMEPCKKALADAGKKVGDIDEVVLVGGSTRMPAGAGQEVEEFFGKEPNKSVNAGRGGGARRRHPGRRPVRRGQGHPAPGRDPADPRRSRPRAAWLHRHHPAEHHHPDPQVGDLLHRLGQPAHGGGPRPAGRAADGARQQDPGQASSWTGIPAAPRGVPQIEVTFDIDANGILNVTARDKATGVEKQIRIEASSGLSEADIKRAVDDAAAHESEDKARKETIEARNKLDTLIYSTRKLVTDSGSKIGDADKLMIEEALKDADRVLEANRDATTPDDLNAGYHTLEAAAHKLAEAMYKQAGAGDAGGGDAGAGDGGGAGGGDVIDAEFEDKA